MGVGAQPPTRQLCSHAQIATEERRNTSTGTPRHERQSQPRPTHSLNYELSLLLLGVIKCTVTGTTNTHKKEQGSKWDTYIYWSTVLYGNRSDIWKNNCLHTNLKTSRHYNFTKTYLNDSFELKNTIGSRYNAVENTIFWTQRANEIKKARIRFILWTCNTHPIPRPYGRAMGRPLWILWSKMKRIRDISRAQNVIITEINAEITSEALPKGEIKR